jgi:hypothetical protein
MSKRKPGSGISLLLSSRERPWEAERISIIDIEG